MRLDERYERILEWFQINAAGAASELVFRNPFELLVAVVLSAQCTDKRVNMVTPALFEAYPDAGSMALASVDEIFGYISSISYPNNKARHLKGLAQALVERFDGEVPSDAESLQSLPGVGRKTANVMLAVAFDTPAMPVDTHVFRVAHRLGLVGKNVSTPLLTEKVLVAHIPEKMLGDAHHWLLLHGRYVCTALKPKCDGCGLRPYCKNGAMQQ